METNTPEDGLIGERTAAVIENTRQVHEPLHRMPARVLREALFLACGADESELDGLNHAIGTLPVPKTPQEALEVAADLTERYRAKYGRP